ncbi:MAG: hypothetical protein K2Q09_05365, partial [Phycisphaerales bacterium]|nr:hypothetical protein [Phycisphaerales bacterium]
MLDLPFLLPPFAITAAASFALAMLLTLLPRSGAGRRLADTLARAPFLDVLVALFTWAPWVAAWILLGARTIPAVIAGQIVALTLWIFIHERMYPNARRGPRIVTFLNRTVGRLRNHTALWLTVPALPVFLSIRLAQVTFYPMLTAVVRLPRYRQGEWVNVSRHKFEGLVGHDLIWCLYCDWMTGVWSLGGEMLRNV